MLHRVFDSAGGREETPMVGNDPGKFASEEEINELVRESEARATGWYHGDRVTLTGRDIAQLQLQRFASGTDQ